MRYSVRLSLLVFIALFSLVFICFSSYKTRAKDDHSNIADGATCVSPPPGMVAWWPGEGNGNDIRGENNGSLQGGATFGVGEVGQAFSFNGNSQFVSVPDSPSLNPTNQITIDSWVFPTADVSTNSAWFIDKAPLNESPVTSVQYQLSRRGTEPCPTGNIPTGNFMFYLGISGQPLACKGWVDGGANLPLNTWSHVALTYNGAAVTAYVNGIQTNQFAASGAIATSAGTLNIGSHHIVSDTSFGQPWIGKLDEVEIFNRALSQTEIQNIVNAGSFGKCRPRCSPPPSSGMVSWWDGDDDPFDRQGTNHGVFSGTSAYGTGKVGRAFSFAGSGFVSVPDNPTLNPPTGRITVDAWVKPASVQPRAPIINKRTPANNTGYTLEQLFDGSGLVLWNLIIGGTSVGVVSSVVLPLNTWTHVAGTYDGTTSRLYFNGIEVGNATSSGSIDPSPGADLQIGRNIVTPSLFDGLIDEVEVFNRALSATEIQAIVNAASAGKCKQCLPPPANMIGWWNADANSNDSSGSGNNGTLNGGMGYAIGKVGQSFSLDGQDDFAEAPDSASLSITGAISIDAWIRANTTAPQQQSLITKYNSPANQVSYGLFLNVGGQLRFVIYQAGDASIFRGVDTATGVIAANTLYHVTGTFNPANQETKIYVNGVDLPTTPVGGSQPVSSIFDSTAPLRIGAVVNSSAGIEPFAGLIDEVEIFDRALSQTEIQSIVAAGASGKCKTGCVPPPANLVSWWPGESNPKDIQDGNDGTLQGGAGFANGKVGQAFNLDGVDDFVQIPHSNTLNPSGPFSVDVWIRANSTQSSAQSLIVDKSHGFADGTGWAMQTNANGTVAFFYGTGLGGSDFHGVDTLTSVLDNQWHHLAGVFTGTEFRIYMDGVLQNTLAFNAPISNNTRAVNIGASWGGGTPTRFFRGLIDEVEYFNRALSPDEVLGIFKAGSAGKCKFATQNGISTRAGDASITFGNGTTPGTTTYQTRDTYQSGPMPFGFNAPLHVADISTTAGLLGTTRVCFDLQAPDFTAAPFTQLRVLHLEGNNLINRTSFASPNTRTLCADVGSFSQFVIARDTTAPTAAPATIAGQVTKPDGSAAAGVTMNLSGARLGHTITDANGYYRFDNVNTDNFYTVTPSRVNYHFDPADRSFSLLANKSDAVFTAVPDLVLVGNAIDTPDYFVRQHYLDFLGREPDESGFNFWSDQIASCGTDLNCLERKRINVSAAYFLSIEFQQTGGLIDSLYKASYGRRPLYAEFIPDTTRLARNVIVGRGDWQQQLVANKQAFIADWVERSAFRDAYDNLNNEAYVAALIANTGVNFTPGERGEIVNGLANGTLTRAGALLRIAEDERFVGAKRNETFVMMEYFGYLRRDPDESGYQFWLNKLNQFNGNFEQAEMVKAFLVSGEYRARFFR